MSSECQRRERCGLKGSWQTVPDVWAGDRKTPHPQCCRRPWSVRRQTYGYLPVADHRRRAINAKFYCLVTEARVCERLAHSRYLAVERPGVELATSRLARKRQQAIDNLPVDQQTVKQ